MEFTRVLLADLVAFPELAGATIALHDIDPERLETATLIVEDVTRTTGAPLRLESHLQSFVLRFARDGEDLYPRLDEAIERDPDGLGRRTRIEIYRRLGYFPTESSEHSAEYVPWFMRHDGELERFRIPVDEYIRRSLENVEEYAQTLPPQCAALNRTFLNVVELTVRAALEERRDHVHHAVLLDPNAAATLTTAQAHELVEEMIAAHGELLPAGIAAAPRRAATAVRRS